MAPSQGLLSSSSDAVATERPSTPYSSSASPPTQSGGAPSTSPGTAAVAAISAAERLPMPSVNPLPLSAAQEQQVRELYYKRVRGYCADEIKRMSIFLT